jgi:uroporphyrinogen-III synthase
MERTGVLAGLRPVAKRIVIRGHSFNATPPPRAGNVDKPPGRQPWGRLGRRMSEFRWDSRKLGKPLDGIRVLVGRARHQAGALSSRLRNLGAEVLEIPFIEIRRPRSFQPLDEALQRLATYDWLILTSVNGVEAMWDRLAKLRLTNDSLRHLKIAAIGPATKRAIEKNGVRVHVVPEEYVAESVVKSLRKQVKGKRVLLVRAKVARDLIPRELRKAGAPVDVFEAYETVVPKASRRRLQAVLGNQKRRPHVITFTSSSTVKNFAALLGRASRPKPRRPPLLDGVVLASIGPVTSATLRELKLNADVEAQPYTIPGLVAAIVGHRRARSKPTTRFDH